MFPHERSLVQRYKASPFALLGVNLNGDVEILERAERKYGLLWRSWVDNGQISEAWHVHSLPAVYLIDHHGVIRFSSLEPPDPGALDKKIDDLVRQAEADAKSS